jgi:hypothetical protein
MTLFPAQGARALKCLLLAFIVLFAQQAAQLHALGHAEEQLAQPHKGKAPPHSIEQCCIAFHAVGSALTAILAAPEFDSRHSERTPWFRSEARASAVYRLPARAPPQAIQL